MSGVVSRTSALLLLLPLPAVLGSCDPEDGPLPPASVCEVDADCRDDGLHCNGRPVCAEQMFMTARGPWRVKSCVPGDPPCDLTEVCFEDLEFDRADCRCSDPDPDGDGEPSIDCGGVDCDDEDGRRAPSHSEVCDNEDLDEDCDPSTFGVRDSDMDGWPDAACCNGETCGNDCDDRSAGTHPSAVEACDGLDNDCDGRIDEGVTASLYQDDDGDGFGAGEASNECADATGYSTLSGDCDDDNPFLHIGTFRCKEDVGTEIELCDGEWVDEVCPDLGLCVPQPGGHGVCLPGDGTSECNDGEDNDDDGSVDWADEQCRSPTDDSEAARACDDGDDDDDDALADYPNDPGCTSTEDNNEADPAAPPACANGLDDDDDGATDFVPDGEGDPGCVSASDSSERQAGGATCDNGVDDDGDSTADFPADVTCLSRDADEIPACMNELDDDLDGLVDSADPGCTKVDDESERQLGGNYACDNSIDDDADMVTDYPGDPGCSGPMDNMED